MSLSLETSFIFRGGRQPGSSHGEIELKILVTGGAGFIGSHTLLEIVGDGHRVCVIDNFSNSSPEVLDLVREISGCEVEQFTADINDGAALDRIFSSFRPDVVVHLAGLKAVAESAQQPLAYYRVNVGGTQNLLQCMESYGCRAIVFSSSATVYGDPQYVPYDEAHPLAPMNVYGRTKYFAEEMIKDWVRAHEGRKAILLRYFNPVGAHPSGKIGENPKGIPDNLMPFIANVAVGKEPQLKIFGGDYSTSDGTGVRDYLHVCDLAVGHLNAINYLADCRGVEVFNLGTGKGVSVLQLVEAFEKASGVSIPYEIVDRRTGDLPEFWANANLAEERLGWTAERELPEMCSDAWNWVKRLAQI